MLCAYRSRISSHPLACGLKVSSQLSQPVNSEIALSSDIFARRCNLLEAREFIKDFAPSTVCRPSPVSHSEINLCAG